MLHSCPSFRNMWVYSCLHKHIHSTTDTYVQEQNTNYKTNEYSLLTVECLENLEKHKRKPFVVFTPRKTWKALLQIHPLDGIFHDLQRENAISTQMAFYHTNFPLSSALCNNTPGMFVAAPEINRLHHSCCDPPLTRNHFFSHCTKRCRGEDLSLPVVPGARLCSHVQENSNKWDWFNTGSGFRAKISCPELGTSLSEQSTFCASVGSWVQVPRMQIQVQCDTLTLVERQERWKMETLWKPAG